jgi:hypothetical protein
MIDHKAPHHYSYWPTWLHIYTIIAHSVKLLISLAPHYDNSWLTWLHNARTMDQSGFTSLELQQKFQIILVNGAMKHSWIVVYSITPVLTTNSLLLAALWWPWELKIPQQHTEIVIFPPFYGKFHNCRHIFRCFSLTCRGQRKRTEQNVTCLNLRYLSQEGLRLKVTF